MCVCVCGFIYYFHTCRAVRSSFWSRASLLGGTLEKSLPPKMMPFSRASSVVSPSNPKSILTKVCRIGLTGAKSAEF